MCLLVDHGATFLADEIASLRTDERIGEALLGIGVFATSSARKNERKFCRINFQIASLLAMDGHTA